MENFPVSVTLNKDVHHFEVGEYLHRTETGCKYKVFENGALVASFEADTHEFLHICQNPGKIDEEILHLLADEIEAHHPQGFNQHINKFNL